MALCACFQTDAGARPVGIPDCCYERVSQDLDLVAGSAGGTPVSSIREAGIKIDSLASELLSKSGRAMTGALIAGERNPARLADLALRRLCHKTGELQMACDGRFTAGHARARRPELPDVAQAILIEGQRQPGSSGISQVSNLRPATSLALILIALTAPVAPDSSMRPRASTTIPGKNRAWDPSMKMPARPRA